MNTSTDPAKSSQRSGLLWKLLAPTAAIFIVAAAFIQFLGWRAVTANFASQSEQRLTAHERILVNLVTQIRNEFSHIGNELLNTVRNNDTATLAQRIEESADLFARLNWAAILNTQSQTLAQWSATTKPDGTAALTIPEGLSTAAISALRPTSWAQCRPDCELVLAVPGALNGHNVVVLLAIPLSDLLAPFKSLTGADAALLHLNKGSAVVSGQTSSVLRATDIDPFHRMASGGGGDFRNGSRNYAYRVVDLVDGMGPLVRIRAVLLEDNTDMLRSARDHAMLQLLEFLLVGAIGLTMLHRNLGRLEALIEVLPRLSETDHYESTRAALLEASPPQKREDEVDQLRDTLISLSQRLEKLHGAEAESDAKSRFLATMSHEIRTPMSGILGLTEILSQTPLNSDQSRMAQMIHDSTHNLLHIINDVLDYSKIEAGATVIDPVPFCPLELVESIADIVSVSAARKNISLRILPASELPRTLVGDMGKIRQVVLNLVSNAVKFTESGHVTLALDGSMNRSGEFDAVFRVEDSGIGIRKDAQEQVFDRFRQAEAGTTRTHGGTGLGLAISRGLVELMHGRLELQSIPGEGSTFSVHLSLPVAAGPDAPRTKIGGLRLAIDLDHEERDCLAAHARRMGAVIVSESKEADITILASKGGDATQIEVLSHQPDAVPRYWTRPIRLSELDSLLHSTLRNEEARQKQHSSALRQFGVRVLVAEDQAVNRELLGRQLGSLGCDYVLCCNGAEALHTIEQDAAFDMLITDLHMPELDGYGLVESLRYHTNEDLRELPIVVLTASAATKDMARLNRYKVNRKLVKPASLTALEQCLGDFFSADTQIERDVLPDENPELDKGQLLDRRMLHEVLGEDLSGLAEYLQMYETLTLPLLDECEQALAKGDLETVKATAHKLVGSTRALGGVELAKMIKKLELGAAAGSPGLEEKMRSIQSTMPTFLTEIRALTANS